MGEDYRVDFVPHKDEAGLIYVGLIIALYVTDIKAAEKKSTKLASIVEPSNDVVESFCEKPVPISSQVNIYGVKKNQKELE